MGRGEHDSHTTAPDRTPYWGTCGESTKNKAKYQLESDLTLIGFSTVRPAVPIIKGILPPPLSRQVTKNGSNYYQILGIQIGDNY